MKTVFSPIIEHREGYIIWEDDQHLAFLTPFPNTPGLTVVIPKKNIGDYVFHLNNDEYLSLMRAAKEVALLLEEALETPRIALIYEGTGVSHVHAKLYPLYGEEASRTGVWSDYVEYSETYRKYLTTVEGPRMSDDKLSEIQQKIIKARNKSTTV